MNDLTQAHDKFFKETFSPIEVARDFFANYLPETVTAVLNLDSLALQPDSFVDADLQEQFADLLYSIELKNGREAYLYALMEHKSYPDAGTPFQLLRYIVRIWERDRRNGEPLRPIIPIVVYHGHTQWNISTDFADLFDGDEVLRPYWPAFQYELQDLTALSDDEIKGEARLQMGMFVLKYILETALRENLRDILSLSKNMENTDDAMEYLRTVLYYIDQASKHVAREEITTAVKALLEDGDNEIMDTVADYWIEQGMEQGIQQGMQKGIQQGMKQGRIDAALQFARQSLAYLDAVTISGMTGLTVEEVRALREVEES